MREPFCVSGLGLSSAKVLKQIPTIKVSLRKPTPSPRFKYHLHDSDSQINTFKISLLDFRHRLPVACWWLPLPFADGISELTQPRQNSWISSSNLLFLSSSLMLYQNLEDVLGAPVFNRRELFKMLTRLSRFPPPLRSPHPDSLYLKPSSGFLSNLK